MLTTRQVADQFISAVPLIHDGETRFIARQPILDCKQQVYGYELLFRAGRNDSFSVESTVVATHTTLELSLLLGAQAFTEGHRAFINCTRESLCSGIVDTLPKDLVVLEILEEVEADEETMKQCHRLKRAGYKIALDDVVSDNARLPLLEIADIIKVDFIQTDAAQQRALVHRFAKHGVQMLAEKVETHEEFHAALRMGYTLFQGYFFCRPLTIVTKDLPSLQMNYLNILRKVYEDELNIPALERAIREEPSLCYRLLRYLNSAAFGLVPVHSIVEALTLLGRDELRKWVSMVTTISLAGTHSTELLRMALCRARFCELVAERLRLPTTDFFLVGLFSLLDAMLDRPMSQLIGHIPISERCRNALMGELNQPALVLMLAIASARGQWATLPHLCADVGCTELDMWEWQLESQNWVRGILEHKADEERVQ